MRKRMFGIGKQVFESETLVHFIFKTNTISGSSANGGMTVKNVQSVEKETERISANV